MALTYIQQNGSTGKSISYPSSSHKSATIATSGCGVCSSLMVLLNSTSNSKTLKAWTKELINNGCRAAEGTNMTKVKSYMKSKYGFSCTVTSSIENLKSHLKKGYKAIANVGGKGYFSSSGHFVCVAGITNGGKAIVLDPYYYTGKWDSTVNGINRGKYFDYNNSTHEVYCAFSTISADSRGDKYYLFTPSTKKKLSYSAKDQHHVAKKKKVNKPKITVGKTVTLAYERGIYKSWGADSGRKKVKDIDASKRKYLSKQSLTADAYFKKNTVCTVNAKKTLSNGNLWIQTPSGYFCIYEYDKDLKRIK